MNPPPAPGNSTILADAASHKAGPSVSDPNTHLFEEERFNPVKEFIIPLCLGIPARTSLSPLRLLELLASNASASYTFFHDQKSKQSNTPIRLRFRFCFLPCSYTFQSNSYFSNLQKSESFPSTVQSKASETISETWKIPNLKPLKKTSLKLKDE